MARQNKYGLTDSIPNRVKREVRQRSKFGCVMCRSAIYQLEHIDPTFAEAREHNADNICCLCGRCHDAVTRNQVSKAAVKASYALVASQSLAEAGEPCGPLDFHDGHAELLIGDLLYSPSVRTVLRYHGADLIKVLPGPQGHAGSISAVFTDDSGREVLRLDQNEWVGSLDNWDIEVTGPRITVRRKAREIILQLRLDPPGRIVIERLDMRFNDAHVLATERTYAAGRYLADGTIFWVWANLKITPGKPSGGAAIEFTDPIQLELNDRRFSGIGSSMATADRNTVMSGAAGVMFKSVGISIASLCLNGFQMYGTASGVREIDPMRNVVFHYPAAIGQFIGTGRVM